MSPRLPSPSARGALIVALALLLAPETIALGTAPGDIAGYLVGLYPEGSVEVFQDRHSSSGRLIGRGWSLAEKDQPLRIQDRIRTHEGRAVIQFADRDEDANAGPSIFNIGTNTEVALASYDIDYDQPKKSRGVIDLIKGTIRNFIKGWGQTSHFSVRAGVAVCGIRGSEQVVSYDPDAAGGKGEVRQTALSGDVFTYSQEIGRFPEEKGLVPGFRRSMRSPDPSTWTDQKLPPGQLKKLIEETEIPGNDGKTADELHRERYGETPDPVGPEPDFWGGTFWTPEGLPDCEASTRGVMLNDYPWSKISDYQDFMFYLDELIAGRFVVSGYVDTDCPEGMVGVAASVDGGASWVETAVDRKPTTFRYEFDPSSFSTLDLRVQPFFRQEWLDRFRLWREGRE